MLYSNLELNARDIDSKKGIVQFYFADFNSVDSHGRRMEKNAFNRTFNNNFKRMVHLFNHDPNTIIGKPLEVGTDEKGAFMTSQLSKSAKGQEVMTLYEEGIIKEHSFGFLIKNSKQDKKIEVVTELQMFEASSVTWGANPNTPVISLNSIEERLEVLESLTGLNETMLNKLDAILARLPDVTHQTSQGDSYSEEINEVINLLKTI